MLGKSWTVFMSSLIFTLLFGFFISPYQSQNSTQIDVLVVFFGLSLLSVSLGSCITTILLTFIFIKEKIIKERYVDISIRTGYLFGVWSFLQFILKVFDLLDLYLFLGSILTFILVWTVLGQTRSKY